MLLLAVAAGAVAAGLLAFARPGFVPELPAFVVPLAAAAGAVAVALADTAPTGWEPFDLLLRVAFGALVPLAAARAGSVTTVWLLVVSTVTLFIAIDAPVPWVAGLAAGAFLALTASGIARPETAAIAAAAAIGPVAHADWPLFTGASAVAVAVATVPVLLVGLVRAPQRARRVGVVVLGFGVVLGVVGAAVGGLAAFDARTDVDRAVDLATDGMDLLGDEDDEARTRLRDAAAHFGDAEDTLTAWWARPALLVPGVAQQSRAVATMASAGADLAITAADASEDADIDSIRPRNGQVDLAALEALAEPLDRSVLALRRADTRLDDIRTPLLLTPVADRLADLRTQVHDALGTAELASQAVAIAPDMLGADGPRRYFLSFQNPSEIRGNGGFMGNWAELTADDGALTLSRSGRVRDLNDASEPADFRLEGEDEFERVYGRVSRSWGLLNFSPDNPTVSRVIHQVYPRSGGSEIDGVLTVSPAGLAAFLELTGPVDVPGYPERLTPDNAERILLHEQYLEFSQETNEERTGFLAEAVETVFDELTSGDLPGPSVLAEELGPAVQGRHLQLWSPREQEQGLFARLGATGSVQRDSVDSFGVVTQNFNGNKIDWFLHRRVAYDAAWDPGSGDVSGSMTVTIENRAPSSGLPHSVIGWGGDVSVGQRPVEDGENYMLVTLYTTFPIDAVTVDGSDVDFVRHDEAGHRTARFFLSVPPRGQRVVNATFSGTTRSGTRYVLRPLRQPTVNPDDFDIRLSAGTDWTVENPGNARTAGPGAVWMESTAAEPVEVDVEFQPDSQGLQSLLDRVRGIG